jgi:signal transduction histidine kinase
MARTARRVLWLELLLVGALASVALILAQTYRAATSSRGVAEGAMRDYAGFAAWSYREHLIMQVRQAIDEVLGPVNHGDGLHMGMEVPDASDLAHYLRWNEKCQCHLPRRGPIPLRYYAFALGSDSLAIAENRAPAGSPGWLVDPPPGQPKRAPAPEHATGDAAWLNALLSKTARRLPRSSWGYDLIVAPRDGVPHIFASRSMPTVSGDTIVYALEYDLSVISAALGQVLAESDLLPPSLVTSPADSGAIDLEVTDASGDVLFRTADHIDWQQSAESQLPADYGGLRVRAQLHPRLASALLIGGTPKSRVPLLLALLALAIGLTIFAAVLLRREVRFAAERADFVASVSHELRTPLTQVRLVLDTLRLGREGDATARDSALGIADREVLRLQHLVEGVLRFTRGPRKDESPRVSGDLLAETRVVVREFAPLAEPKGVTVCVEGDGVVTAAMQQGALRQLLLNLLDNAVKYGRDHGVVTVRVTPRDGGGARIAVSDAGPGVPAADREKIWRAFERGGAARAHAAGGSGIGLTIVRQIAEEHGGRAWVEEADGGGARFVVDIGAVKT